MAWENCRYIGNLKNLVRPGPHRAQCNSAHEFLEHAQTCTLHKTWSVLDHGAQKSTLLIRFSVYYGT